MPPESQDTTDPAEMARELHRLLRNGKDIPYGDDEEQRYYELIVTRWIERFAPALARLASAVGLPGAGVDGIEAAIKDRIARPTSLGEWLALCPDEEAPTYRAVKRLLEQERAARAENERLRAELAEAHDALALALRSGVWKVGPEIAARIRGIKEALGRPAGVAAPEPLAEARDTGTDAPTIAERARAMGIRPHEPEEAFGVSAAPASPVPPAPDEARDAGRNLKIGDQVRWIAWDEGGWEGPASAEDWSTEETGFVEWISLPKVRVNCDTGPRRVTLPVAVLAVSASTPEEATDDHE